MIPNYKYTFRSESVLSSANFVTFKALKFFVVLDIFEKKYLPPVESRYYVFQNISRTKNIFKIVDIFFKVLG